MNAVLGGGRKALTVWPGTLLCLTVALAASFVAEHYGGPKLLYALLMGMTLHFLHGQPKTAAGIDFCGRTVLRLGVALLGARITFEQVRVLGWTTLAFAILAVLLTIVVGVALARLFGQRTEDGLLSGGAVAICGASAELAISAVLPPSRENQRFTLLTVVGVTVLSTLAMIGYPFLLRAFDVSPTASGVFLGGTIHDVAQVVAAGTLVGPAAADSATLVKLFRVLLLVPVVVVVAWLFRSARSAGNASTRAAPLVPGFLLGFVLLMTAASLGWMPAAATQLASDGSRWLLVIAIAAVGIKTSLEELLQLGWQPALLLLAETAFLAAFFLLAVRFGPV